MQHQSWQDESVVNIRQTRPTRECNETDYYRLCHLLAASCTAMKLPGVTAPLLFAPVPFAFHQRMLLDEIDTGSSCRRRDPGRIFQHFPVSLMTRLPIAAVPDLQRALRSAGPFYQLALERCCLGYLVHQDGVSDAVAPTICSLELELARRSRGLAFSSTVARCVDANCSILVSGFTEDGAPAEVVIIATFDLAFHPPV